LEDLDVDGKINGSYGSKVGGCGLDSSGSGEGPTVSSCERGNELSGSIKVGNFLTSWATTNLSKSALS